MIMHREATKSKALDEIARVWGIERTEIVAFGDDLNDVDLLVYAGIRVATGKSEHTRWIRNEQQRYFTHRNRATRY